jgi:hypothetical protein
MRSSSGTSDDVRLDLIGGEDVAKLPLCDAVFGEEDDACLLCFLSHEGVWWRGLFRSWARLATWVATWLRWPSKVSLSPFLISGFFFYVSLFEFKFKICFACRYPTF